MRRLRSGEGRKKLIYEAHSLMFPVIRGYAHPLLAAVGGPHCHDYYQLNDRFHFVWDSHSHTKYMDGLSHAHSLKQNLQNFECNVLLLLLLWKYAGVLK